MLALRTLSTMEIDDPELAVREILAQLEAEPVQGRNSLGIISCHPDFLKTETEKTLPEMLAAALPFPIVGFTSFGSATEQGCGLDMLALSILSSDDISFSPALTASLAAEQETPIKEAFESAAAHLPDKPSFILAFPPMLANVGGEKLVHCLDSIAPQVPMFGTLPCDHNFDFHESQILFQGEQYPDRMAIVLMSGPVNPKFLTISVPEGNVQKQSAVITESEGNVVRQVNNKPVLDYLEDLGLSRSNGLEGSKSIPIILDYNDGTQPVARCFYMITPEGYAACGGEMPTGASLALGTMNYDDVLLSTDQILDHIFKDYNATSMLVLSCIVRSVTLGTEQMAEMNRVQERMGKKLPYHLAYSGGEICPVYGKNGNTANRFHNFSFTVCVFS